MISPFSTIRVYHGTNLFFALIIKRYGIWFNVQRKKTDFGRGFYVTPTKKQAIAWARERAKHPPINRNVLSALSISYSEYKLHPYTNIPALIQFDLNVSQLFLLYGIIFPLPPSPFWNIYKHHIEKFVYSCRSGFPHSYDFIFGPISKFHDSIPKKIDFSRTKNQLSLNSSQAIRCLANMHVFLIPTVHQHNELFTYMN